MLDALRVAPGSSSRVHDRATDAVRGVDLKKADADAELGTRTDQLGLLQQRLHAEGERALLLVLQVMDPRLRADPPELTGIEIR